MTVALTIFPGTNGDHDLEHLFGRLLGMPVCPVWHRDRDLGDAELVVIPGGFSYGDYLRTGALAKLSPVMESVREFADKGGKVLGICNGFQILCEAGLLPGALSVNRCMKFLSRSVHVVVEQCDTPFTQKCSPGDVLDLPIAHFEGRYVAEPETLAALELNRQVIFRYVDRSGAKDPENFSSNPNGSMNAIAGVCNERRNVVGLMPHPERWLEEATGGIDGRKLFAAPDTFPAFGG